MRLLALDFDGVISDSAPESFLVALRTYLALRPTSRFEAELALLEKALGAGRLSVSAIVALELYRKFTELIPLGNRAEDYGVALASIESGADLPDQVAYDATRAGETAEFLDLFHERFYRERRALAEAEPELWLGLMRPYPQFLEMLRRRASDAILAIATAKDRQSVDRLLRQYGVGDLFDSEMMMDKEAGLSKRVHLETLARRTRVPLEQITFVDDKLNHLEDVASLGVRCVLAAWGYNGEREHRAASARGFLVCGQQDAERKLFG